MTDFGRQFQGRRFSGSLEDYLLARYDLEPATGCWVWKMSTAGAGYGYFLWQGRWTYAHRAAWAAWRGPVPSGQYVLHHCDNPRCLNPDHLFVGSQAENLADMCQKGRHVSNSEALKEHYRAKRRRLDHAG
jgi:hypothetical protein